MPDIKQQIDREAALLFLRQITQGWEDLAEPVMLELRCLFPGKTPNYAHFLPDEAGLALAVDHAEVMNGFGLNIYPVINPVLKANIVAGNAAKDADIAAAFYHWADSDEEASTEALRSFAGPRPNMVVLTGSVPFPRPHAYWRIADGPITDLKAWRAVQEGIAATLGTDRTVVNASRIMRLPGMVNWPTKDKAEKKGRIPEIATMAVYEDREPVPFERMQRTFGGAVPAVSKSDSFTIDTGEFGETLDRALASANIMAGTDWRENVKKLVASYVARGWTDDEIIGRCLAFTLPGWTPEETQKDVAAFIKWTREQEAKHGGKYAVSPEQTVSRSEKTFEPNFDHTPAPTASDPQPGTTQWQVQRAADFTSDFVAPEYVVDGVIQRGRLYTLTAPTGSGKTAVMLYMATAIATGEQFCGIDVEQGDVLFLAGENPDDVRARVIATLEFYGVDPATVRLHFVAGTFSIRADMQRLREEAEKLPNLIMVVVDTFAAYFDGEDENSNAQALDFARVVRGLTVTQSKPCVVMPAHPIKNASRSNLSPKGGSSLVNEVDGNLTLWNSDGLLTMHWQVKHRGPDFEPLQLELKRHECEAIQDRKGRLMPTILAQPVLSLRATQIARETLSLEDQVLLSIGDDSSLTKRQRAEALGIAGTRYQRTIDRLREQKLIKKFRSKWELTKDGKRAVDEIIEGNSQPPEIDL